MLYINVFLVSQQYSGPEEGGSYHYIGTPLASIPVDAKREVGQAYYISMNDNKVSISISKCPYCNGTGKTEEEWEDGNDDIYPDRPLNVVDCKDCGLVPVDVKKCAEMMDIEHERFSGEPGRYENIIVKLDDKFAAGYNTYQPYS